MSDSNQDTTHSDVTTDAPRDTGTTTSIDSTTETTDTAIPTTATTSRINPFGSEQITVGISAPPNRTINFTEIAESAVSYWQNNREEAGRYHENPVELVFEPDAENPDLLLEYSPTIGRCNGEYETDTFLKCTETVEADSVVSGQLTYKIASRYTAEDTEGITRQALNSVYGYQHRSGNDWHEGPELRDPWVTKDTVVVGITDQTESNRDFEPLVRDALEYWSNSTHGDYEVNWQVRPDAPQPDVMVSFEESITDCGFSISTDSSLGCAPLLERTESTYDVLDVRIATGYTDNSTTSTIKHEFGHVLGLDHGEEPMPLMAAEYDATRQSMTNATDRAISWERNVISVGVAPGVSSGTESQAEAVVEHLNSQDSQPENLTLNYVGTSNSSDIVIREDQSGECELEQGSCRTIFGINLDADERLEYYTGGEIYLTSLEGETAGWHIGYWLDRIVSPTMTDSAWDDDDDDRDWQ